MFAPSPHPCYDCVSNSVTWGTAAVRKNNGVKGSSANDIRGASEQPPSSVRLDSNSPLTPPKPSVDPLLSWGFAASTEMASLQPADAMAQSSRFSGNGRSLRSPLSGVGGSASNNSGSGSPCLAMSGVQLLCGIDFSVAPLLHAISPGRFPAPPPPVSPHPSVEVPPLVGYFPSGHGSASSSEDEDEELVFLCLFKPAIDGVDLHSLCASLISHFTQVKSIF